MALNVGSPIISTNGLIVSFDPASRLNYVLSEVEVLVVAGGGGGGSHHGGGGGGGGVLYTPSYSVTSSAITVTVGNGGAGGIYNNQNGQPGQNSAFGNLAAIGGGGGGTYPNAGAGGGSGGGPNNWGVGANGGSGTVGQGFAGGRNNGENNFGGGGGGAGQPGGQGRARNSGGNGLPFSISGKLTYYGGGGGAGTYPGYTFDGDYGAGGLGGGGAGGQGPHSAGTAPTAGTPNTGGGGGGVADLNQNGGVGGSGVVIVRYPGPQKATGGNTISTIDGYTIHTFTSSGTFTPLSFPTNGTVVNGLYDLSNNLNTAYQPYSTSYRPVYNTNNGGVLTFDGVDDFLQIKRIASTLNLKAGLGGNGFTVLFWARSTQGTGSWEKFIGNDDADNYIDLYQSPGGLYWQECGSTLYVDGNQVGQGAVTATNSGWHFYGATNFNAGTIRNPSRDLAIGNEPDFARNYAFSMDFGQLFIYNRILSLSEINQIFNSTRTRYGI